MGFIKKETALLKKLKETGYKLFDGDKDEALDFIGKKLEKFPNYANIIIQQQQMMPIWRYRYEGQELRDRIQDMDTKRKMAHDSAIASLNALNRLSVKLGLEPFADINTKDRHAVAKFIGEYINETYNDGINNAPAEAAYQRTKEYNTRKPMDRLQQIEQLTKNIQWKGDKEDNEQVYIP